MTPEDAKKMMAFVDTHVSRALEKNGAKIPCCKGCFHCCKEPVYSTKSEVRYILSQLNEEQIAALKVKLHTWREAFEGNSELLLANMPNVLTYRALNLWCPLLINGECSVYEDRPIACRMHIARENSKGCEDDALRLEQKFTLFPDLSLALTDIQLQSMQVGEDEHMDHFCMLLCQELFTPGRTTHITGSRLIFKHTSEDTLEILKFNETPKETLGTA